MKGIQLPANHHESWVFLRICLYVLKSAFFKQIKIFASQFFTKICYHPGAKLRDITVSMYNGNIIYSALHRSITA